MLKTSSLVVLLSSAALSIVHQRPPTTFQYTIGHQESAKQQYTLRPLENDQQTLLCHEPAPANVTSPLAESSVALMAVNSADQTLAVLYNALKNLDAIGLTDRVSLYSNRYIFDIQRKIDNLKLRLNRPNQYKFKDISKDAYRAAQQAANLVFIIYKDYQTTKGRHAHEQDYLDLLQGISKMIQSATIASQNAMIAYKYLDNLDDAIEDKDLEPAPATFFYQQNADL